MPDSIARFARSEGATAGDVVVEEGILQRCRSARRLMTEEEGSSNI